MKKILKEQELESFGERFIVSFEACRRALAIYPGKHPNVGLHMKRFMDNLEGLRAKAGHAMINVSNGEFFVNGVPLKKLSITHEKNISSWEEPGIGLIR